MTQGLSIFMSEFKSSLKKFSLPQNQNIEEMKNSLLRLKLQSDQDITKLNTFLERQIRTALTQVMANAHLEKVAKLIALLCDVSIQQKYGINNSLKPCIKQSLAIIIVQDVLECLGINDLRQILPIITQKICSFKQLDINDQNRMLRIINHLLKRISKTEDYLIRGQLQFTLTKILPICHDSGFHYRIPIAKGIQIAQDQQAQQYKAVFNAEGITYQFYKDFWQLQKYLMDPNELCSNQQNLKNGLDQTPKKSASAFKSQPLISLRLKHIEKVLNEIISYMTKHEFDQTSVSLLNQPIKFLTNTHLLQFQLSDKYFRKIILAQVLVFTFTLKHLKPTGNILKNVMLTQSERQIINRIQTIAQKYLDLIQKKQQAKNLKNIENQNDGFSLFQAMKVYFSNQLQWLQLKDHWKQKKKAFLRTEPLITQTQLKQRKSKQGIDYNKKISEIQNKISSQMNIQGDTLLKFLTEPFVPHIVTTPTQTSFASYWSQAKSCLDGFDYQNLQQHQFQSKAEYNMFEWKALKSLYKQSSKEISLGEKNPKFRDYKALAYVQKKQKQFKEKSARFISENLLPSESKINNHPVILQVTQSKQASKNKQIKQNISEKQPAQQSNIMENQQSKGPSPSKKLKSD